MHRYNLRNRNGRGKKKTSAPPAAPPEEEPPEPASPEPVEAPASPKKEAPVPSPRTSRANLVAEIAQVFPSKYMNRRAAKLLAAEEESDGYETVDSVEDEDYDPDEDEEGTTEDEDEEEAGGLNIFVMDGSRSDSDESSGDDSPTSRFKKLIRRKGPSEVKHFKGLPAEEKERVLEQLRALQGYEEGQEPDLMKLLKNDAISTQSKAVVLKMMTAAREASDGERQKMLYFIRAFGDIPFGKLCRLPVTIDDGLDACRTFVTETRATLDDAVYGLDDVKIQILQWIAKAINSPKATGTVIGIQGPMGTGKTTLVKEGICKALRRPFAFIPLGGATDSANLEGHHPTYEGARWGAIAQVLMDAGCMNPVIYFDELDKVSDTAKGREIYQFLVHLTDPSQNDKFSDKFFVGCEMNIKDAIIIFSFNHEDQIDRILRDRMYIVRTEGYDLPAKLAIAQKFIVPRMREKVRLTEAEVVFPDAALVDIIRNYTGNEEGVRNLGRCIESVLDKINLKRFETPGLSLFAKDADFEAQFPMVVTTELTAKLLKNAKPRPANMSMYL